MTRAGGREALARVGAEVARELGRRIAEAFLDRATELFTALVEGRAKPGATLPTPIETAGRVTGPVLVLHLSAHVEQRLAELDRARASLSGANAVDAVHDVRVASRRLDTFFHAFREWGDAEAHREARRILRRMRRSLGRLRELDVTRELLAAALTRAADDAERAALEHVIEGLDRRRARARKRAGGGVRRGRVERVRELARAALRRITEHASTNPTALSELTRQIVGPAVADVTVRRADIRAENAEDLHRLRVAAKKLRYSLELVEPELGERYRHLERTAKTLQTVLGEHHDRAVLEVLLERKRGMLEKHGHATLARGASQVALAVARERRAVFERFVAARPDDALTREARALIA